MFAFAETNIFPNISKRNNAKSLRVGCVNSCEKVWVTNTWVLCTCAGGTKDCWHKGLRSPCCKNSMILRNSGWNFQDIRQSRTVGPEDIPMLKIMFLLEARRHGVSSVVRVVASSQRHTGSQPGRKKLNRTAEMSTEIRNKKPSISPTKETPRTTQENQSVSICFCVCSGTHQFQVPNSTENSQTIRMWCHVLFVNPDSKTLHHSNHQSIQQNA